MPQGDYYRPSARYTSESVLVISWTELSGLAARRGWSLQSFRLPVVARAIHGRTRIERKKKKSSEHLGICPDATGLEVPGDQPAVTLGGSGRDLEKGCVWRKSCVFSWARRDARERWRDWRGCFWRRPASVGEMPNAHRTQNPSFSRSRVGTHLSAHNQIVHISLHQGQKTPNSPT